MHGKTKARHNPGSPDSTDRIEAFRRRATVLVFPEPGEPSVKGGGGGLWDQGTSNLCETGNPNMLVVLCDQVVFVFL